jgi:hypothetical protein
VRYDTHHVAPLAIPYPAKKLEMKMDQIAISNMTPAERRRAARLAKGYSLEDLAIATGLTVGEIAAAERLDKTVPRNHADRIEHALG